MKIIEDLLGKQFVSYQKNEFSSPPNWPLETRDFEG
jgi:hypothetical protein